MSFESFELDSLLSANLASIMYKTPTPIQQKAIPLILEDKNVVAISNTGTGKTASFCIPIVHNLIFDPKPFFGIILEPTRELAFQVLEQLKIFSKGFSLRTALLIGGQDINIQLNQLTDIPHLIVATPGRLAYLMKESAYAFELLSNLKYLVFDEFDQLLSDSMMPEIDFIEKEAKSAMKLFFSATFDPKIAENPKVKEIVGESTKIDLTEGQDSKIVKTVKQVCF